MEFDEQYYKALIGTFLLILLIAMGTALLTYNRFSYIWSIGAMNIIGCFIIMFYINYKFLVYTKEKIKGEKEQ
jgi:hypothetical protein